MKLHVTAIDRINRVFEMWGGRSNNAKVAEELLKLDFAVYHRKSDDVDVIVMKEELEAQKP